MNRRVLTLVVAICVVLSGCQGFTGGPSPPETSTETTTPAVEAAAAQTGTPTPQTDTVPVVTEQVNPTWSLSLLIVDATPEPGGTFNATVATGGRHTGVISGVVVQFIAENGTIISEVPIGNITQLGTRHWINTTIPTVPVYIVPKVEEWDTPESEFVQIQGTYITEDGEFRPYTVTDPANFTR
ncbi:hypothetical protein [Halosimplex sp. TS25]|uniref:hypothetical protein n=1 Tax=Halosimplex rarum TaxID=3396619 RepID=UPI0039EB2BD8